MGNACCAPKDMSQSQIHIKRRSSKKQSIKKSSMANTKIESQMDFYKTDNLVLERKRSTKSKPIEIEDNNSQNVQEMSRSAPQANILSKTSGLIKEPIDQKESPMIQRRAPEYQNRQNSVNFGQYTTEQSFTEAGVTLLDSEAPTFDRPLSSNINRVTNRQAIGSIVKLECIQEIQQVEIMSQKSQSLQEEEGKHIEDQDTPPNELQAFAENQKDDELQPLENILDTDKNSDRNEDLQFYENEHQLLDDFHNENQLHQIDELLSQELSASHQLSSRLHNIHNMKNANFDLPMDSARSYAKLHTDSIVESQKGDKIRSDSVVDPKALQLDMTVNKMMRQTEICNSSSPFDANVVYQPIKQKQITQISQREDICNPTNIEVLSKEKENGKPKFFIDVAKCAIQSTPQQSIIIQQQNADAVDSSSESLSSSISDSNLSDGQQNQKVEVNNQQKEEESKHSMSSFIDEKAHEDEMIGHERQEPEEPFDSQSSEGDYSSNSSEQMQQQDQENDQLSEVARILDSSEDENDRKASNQSFNENKSETSGNGGALNRSGSFGLNKSGLLTPTALRHRSILYAQGKSTPQATLNKPSGLRPPSTTRIPQALLPQQSFEDSLKDKFKKGVVSKVNSSAIKNPASPTKSIRRMTTLQLQKQTSLTGSKKKSLLPSPKNQLKKQNSIFSNSPAVGRMSVGNKLATPSQQSIKPLVPSSPPHRRNTSFQLPASPASHSLITNSLELFRAQKRNGVQPGKQQTKALSQANDPALEAEEEETSLEKEQEVDEMVIDYIRNNKLKVPIQRIEGSKYLFGTKVIIASILNGGLNVRVGGGFMTIDQFVTQHSGAESFKLRVMASQEKKKVPKIMQELTEKYKQNKKQFVQ